MCRSGKHAPGVCSEKGRRLSRSPGRYSVGHGLTAPPCRVGGTPATLFGITNPTALRNLPHRMPALFADSLTRRALRLLRFSGCLQWTGPCCSTNGLKGARPQWLGSWPSPAVHETCRGITHTGSNRLTCPARLTLPAVADSIGLGCCISAVADCAGFVFPAPCVRVHLFPGCLSSPIRVSKIR